MPAGRLLASPASYLTLANLKADTSLDLTDRKGNAIPDDVLTDFLEEAAGEIDAVTGQSWLARETTRRLEGNGTDVLRLGYAPLIYVKQVKIVLPTTAGFDVPLSALRVDYESGTLTNVSPLLFQGIGVTSYFPTGTPIDVTFAYGVNYPIPAPTFTTKIIPGNSPTALPPGTYPVQTSSVTVSGESLPSVVQNVTLTDYGAIEVDITNAPGALKYYVYIAGQLAGEIEAQVLGVGTVNVTVDASTPTIPTAYDFTGARKAPVTVDGTPWPLQGDLAALRRATKFLIQQNLWEMKNLSNQGVSQQRSGPKSVSYRDSTKSTFAARLDNILTSLKWNGIAES